MNIEFQFFFYLIEINNLILYFEQFSSICTAEIIVTTLDMKKLENLAQ